MRDQGQLKCDVFASELDAEDNPVGNFETLPKGTTYYVIGGAAKSVGGASGSGYAPAFYTIVADGRLWKVEAGALEKCADS